VVGHRPVVGTLGRGDQHAVVGRRRHVDRLEADAPARDVLQRVGALEHGPGVPLGRGGDHGVIALHQLDDLLLGRPSAGPAVGADVPAGVEKRLKSRIVGPRHSGGCHQ
jgi:hypothetical protein